MNIKKKLKNNRTFIWLYNKIFNKYNIKKGNKLILRRCRTGGGIFTVKGVNNTVIIDAGAILKNLQIDIFGNNNEVFIGKNVIAHDLKIWLEDDNNKINISDDVTVSGNTSLACIEGTEIFVGKDCMLSSNIHIVTGDSHSLMTLSGERFNPSKSIHIGSHVWIGTDCRILKGVHIGDNNVIGAGSLVTKSFSDNNTIIAGVPSKIIKEKILWDRKRIKTNP